LNTVAVLQGDSAAIAFENDPMLKAESLAAIRMFAMAA